MAAWWKKGWFIKILDKYKIQALLLDEKYTVRYATNMQVERV